MKCKLSLFAPAARLSLWKVLLVSLAVSAVQAFSYLSVLWQWSSDAYPSAEYLVQAGNLSRFFGIGLVLLCALLLLPGMERSGSKLGYTLARLPVAEWKLTLLWGVQNALLLLIYWGIQTAVALCLSQYFISGAAVGTVSHQSLALACWRSPYLHALVPTGDIPLLVRSLAGCLTLGLSAAALPFHWRHGRKAFSLLPIAVICAVCFPQGIASANPCFFGTVFLVVAGLLTAWGVWRWHEDEE